MRDTTAHLVNIVISYNFVVDDYVFGTFVCMSDFDETWPTDIQGGPN